jgi:hypothetical protein
MTASTPTQTYSRPLAGPGIAIVASASAAGLLALVAISVASLAVAFPIVLSGVDDGRITLSASDLATSRQLADMAWAFVAIGALHLVAAIGAVGDSRWLQRIGITITGAGAGGSAAAAVSLLRDGGAGAADGVAMLIVATGVYLFALAAIATRRRITT